MQAVKYHIQSKVKSNYVAILRAFRCLNVDLGEIDVSANIKDSKVSSDTCRIEPKIPFFLIVAGILNIALLILRAIFQVTSND